MINYIQFFPTLRCNKDCEFCFNRKNRYVNSIDFLSEKIEEFVKIMKENKIFSLDILGGEPFLYEPLESLVKLAIDSDIKVTISTNGSFNEKIESLLNIIKNSRLQIGISINNEIDQSLLDLVKKHKLWIKSVVTKNQPFHKELIEFAKKCGINYYLIYMDALTKKDLELSIPFYEFMELIKELQSQYSGIQPVYCKGFIGGDEKYRCPAGIEKITVMPDGSVYPCYLLSSFEEYCIGNIFKNSLQEILMSDNLRIFKTSLNNSCDNKVCKIKKQCRGGCVAHSIIHYTVPYKADPRCKMKTQEE
ncbi:radical SAM additional 4Fe4S-binding SPASM domain-containing protein [Thermodesulfovibrio aggregans]|uniref:Radical SAM additional 4Fe4S-binding SPASM domain-containing protein n=1 Tax=Thermodesulfovibrio aggregans TaxID=86166 RepID=A0A0U9HM85_9BACT|nr:radical SAM/SPASM domain-containing protein [Thermodesulfovibrio aggregans]GAQ94192.1 radical SAM additional 4Fe4S-binding SPASM domain-containing protein [Thermodesulfovibrio aggregans]